MPTTATGRIIAARYLLISKLGAGGMGITYRAWDLAGNVPVVVKMPKQEAQSDHEALRRFAREVDAMRSLPHTHIVPIIDHGKEDGCPYVVMRFLPGGSLADHRRRDDNGTPLANPPGMLHFWLPAVAEALDFIHRRGVLHRDVKPGNIFFDGIWNAFLGDFGIAKVVDASAGLSKDQTLTGTMIAVGTPEYMAPELFGPKATPDGRADQYALAITVYEMLRGAKPFTGTKAHIVVEHLTVPAAPLHSAGLGIPRSLGFAVDRALAKKPSERFTTCVEFAQAALRDVAPLQPEPNIARLMCPSCATILRMPTTVGGRWGTCPKCKAAMRVAADLSALWLENEQPKNTAPAVTSVADTNRGFPWPKPVRGGPRPQWAAAAAIAALIVALLLSLDWSRGDKPNPLIMRERQRLAAERASLDAERTAIEAERERLAKQQREAQDRVASLAEAVAEGESSDRQNPKPERRAEASTGEARASAAPESQPPAAPDPIQDYGDIVTFRGDVIDEQTAQDLASRPASLWIWSPRNELKLTPEAAERLLAHRGKTMQFVGTLALSPGAAAALARYPGTVAIERLAALPPDVAAALAARTQPLFIGGFEHPPFETAVETLRKGTARLILTSEPSALARALDKASAWLVREQKPDGSWECAMRTQETREGATALVIMALKAAGMKPDHPSMRKGLDWLRSRECKETYSVALQTIALVALSPEADSTIIQRNVKVLEETQVRRGPAAGSWSYNAEKGTGDNSNSQFALLALHEAARVGARVKPAVWSAAHQYWVSSANADESWGYTIGNTAGTGSMTCAGVASTWITSQHLATAGRNTNPDRLICCDGSVTPKTLTRGLEWLGKRFSVSENPGGGQTWHYYFLAGLNRVRRFTGRRFFDGHDMMREAADVLLQAQDRLTGSFRGGRIEDPIVATSMAAMVLGDCNRPALIAKSFHKPTFDSDRHRHDVARLVESINRHLLLDENAACSWHDLDIGEATDVQCDEAPLIFISAKGKFDLGKDAAARVRRHIDAGGMLFAEPACGQSAEFDACLRTLVDAMFVGEAPAFSEVSHDHPLWNTGGFIPAEGRPRLLGISRGGQLCVVYHPLDHDDQPSLSCLWDRSNVSATLAEDSQRDIASALAVGKSIALYAAANRGSPHATRGLYYAHQGRLGCVAKPKLSRQPNEALAKAWSDYDRRHAEAVDQIAWAIREAIDELDKHGQAGTPLARLRLQNALASVLEDGLLPKCTGSAGPAIDAAIASAKLIEESATKNLQDVYEAAIRAASGTIRGEEQAESLRRERERVFGGG